MSYWEFNMGIPAAPDNPSVDQPKMQINNASTLGIIGINHVTFNENTGGYHTTVTFDQTADEQTYAPTSFPVDPPQLFTNIVDGAANSLPPGGNPGLFFYSGAEAASKGQYVSANPGSALGFGGIIVKWGLVSVNAGLQGTNFVSGFPNNCFSVIVNVVNVSPAISVTLTNYTQTGFTTSVNVGPTQISYIAIGN